jgi:hypothetical protein
MVGRAINAWMRTSAISLRTQRCNSTIVANRNIQTNANEEVMVTFERVDTMVVHLLELRPARLDTTMVGYTK